MRVFGRTARDNIAPGAQPVPEFAAASRFGRDDVLAASLFVATAILIVASRWISPSLGSWGQAEAILVISVFVVIIAFGQQIVILTGGLDLSVGATMALGAILMFSWVGGTPQDAIWGVPAVLLITGCVGAVNGLFIALLRVPPLIMTLGTDIVVRGVLLGGTGGSPHGTASPHLIWLFSREALGIPPILLAMVCFVAFATVLQRRTAFGRMLYAIGTSRDAAFIAGLPVKRVTVACYVISSTAAGLAGVLMVGFSQGATLSSGDNVVFASIAAVVVGGTAIIGGRGSYLGAVGGALALTTFSTIISALGLNAGWRTIAYGTIILAALLALQSDPRRWFAPLRSAVSTVRSRRQDTR